MNDQRWEEVLRRLDKQFGGLEFDEVEDEETHAVVESVIWQSPMGRMKLARTTRPLAVDKKLHYSNRAGGGTYVEHVYSDTETTSRLRLYRWSDMTNAWPQSDASAVGARAAAAIDLNRTVEENLEGIAAAKGYDLEDLTVVVLDRPRHDELIRRIRRTGARIHLIPDGDVSAAIATAIESTGVDVLLGVGGAPEGVLAAAALRCLGGTLQGRLILRNDEERGRAKKMGIDDPDRVYTESDLARGDRIVFATTGVTDGDLLPGVHFRAGGAETHSMVMRVQTGTIRTIRTQHAFDHEPHH